VNDSVLKTYAVRPINFGMLDTSCVAHSFRGSADPLKQVSEGKLEGFIGVEI
jgi:hypothetical protein